MANAFKKGDVVVLKSGGPPMTVDGCPGEQKAMGNLKDDYYCRWFKGASQERGAFPEHVLQKFEPPAKK